MTDSDSINIFSITLIAFVWFCSYLHHTITIRQCVFERKLGAEGSVLQELCHFVILTIRFLYCDWYFVKSSPLRVFTGSFQHFADMFRHIEDVREEVWCYKNILLIVHTLWNQLLLELSLNLFNILQICYRHIEDVHEEVWCCLTNLRGF